MDILALECVLQIYEIKGTAQDSTEEGIVTYAAKFIKISRSIEVIGYVCIGTYEYYKNVILEYYLVGKYRADSGMILSHIARCYSCDKWLVNTHDFFAFPVMLDLRLPYEIDAYKFTVESSIMVEYEFDKAATFEVTRQKEINEVYNLIQQDGFYTGGNIETVIPQIKTESIYSLRIDNRLIGVGFISVLERTPSYADIAMIIDWKERKKGWGTLLVKALICRCRDLNIIPTAVCDVNNAASRKTLQQSGFHLDGCLLMAKLHSSSPTINTITANI